MKENDIPVQAEGWSKKLSRAVVPLGYIDWEEHVEAWEGYNQLYPGQDAETIAKRGGFGWNELVEFLGRPPKTWRLREPEHYPDFVPPEGKVGL